MNDIISMLAREFILSGTNITMLTIFTAHMLKRKKSYKLVIIINILKILLVNLIVAVPYGEILRINRIAQGIYIIISIVFSLALYLVFFYTFEGQRVKIVVIATISEILAVSITNPINIGLNALRGASPLEDYTKLHVSDILLVVLAVFITPLICKVLEPIFKRLRTWEIKKKFLWTTLIVLYLSAAIHSYFVRFEQNVLEMYFIVALAMICVFLWYTRLVYRKAAWEKEYLQKQQRLSKLQYSAVALQVEKMEQAHKEINEQMQTLMSLPGDEIRRTELVEQFIGGLKQQSKAILQGMFCDSWFLDAVLCYQMMRCKEKQIDADFCLQEYRKGDIREENLAELLNYLLESFVEGKDVANVSLHVAYIKGQLVLWLTGDGTNAEISKRKIRRYMKGYQTVINTRVSNGKSQLKLTIA